MKIDREKLKKQAEIKCFAWNEDIQPEDSFDDPADVQWAKDELDRGNEWGWCSVEVRAEYGEWSGSDHLGGCSYESREAFMAPGGYYEDMVNTAVEELAQRIERAMAQLELVAEVLA